MHREIFSRSRKDFSSIGTDYCCIIKSSIQKTMLLTTNLTALAKRVLLHLDGVSRL
jgi:hypothetical protein